MGCGWSVWLLARLSYVADVMPVNLRGRALSTLGGVNRVGNFVGPFLGAAVAIWAGTEGAYYVHLVTAVLACALLVFLMRGEGNFPAAQHEHVNFTKVVRENANVFMTAGIGVTAIGALRATRQGVLPLWGDHIGLDESAISLIFGISMGMEMLLFYPAGSVMDRWGRKAVALPCLAIMAVGMSLVPLTGGFWSMVVVGLLVGFGNGLGSGIVMTLGADFSPVAGRAQFLGAWRVCGDIGTAGGPLIVAGVTGIASLAAASVSMGGIGILGAALMFFLMPETLRRDAAVRPPGSRRDLAFQDVPQARINRGVMSEREPHQLGGEHSVYLEQRRVLPERFEVPLHRRNVSASDWPGQRFRQVHLRNVLRRRQHQRRERLAS